MSGEYKNVVGYSPSDFFYVSALDSSQGIDCGNVELRNLALGLPANTIGINGTITTPMSTGTTPMSTGTTPTPMDAKIKLYRDVCLNQSLVKSWTDHKINHAGSNQALNDAQMTYNASVLNTMNLVGGIGFIIWAMTSGWLYR
jgi:hypothetical protein